MLWGQRHADTRPTRRLAVPTSIGSWSKLEMRCATVAAFKVFAPLKEDGELIAASARRHQITVANRLANREPIWRNNASPVWCPEGVVDLLEMIEVDQEQGQAVGRTAFVEWGGQRLLEFLEEASAVRESGELVGNCQVLAD